ncbi:hypothetical protein ACS0TY_034527 [Phlomoides rotata]
MSFIFSPESDEHSESKPGTENVSGSSQTTYSYDQLKSKSETPVTGIDFKKRETYLSNEEFQRVLKMPRATFYTMPKRKHDMLKRKADLL